MRRSATAISQARKRYDPRRMYVYNYRIFDRYNRPVASLAVLADDDADWRPTDFSNNLCRRRWREYFGKT